MTNELIYRRGSTADISGLQRLGVLSYGVHKNALTEENWNKMKSGCGDEKHLS